MSEPMRMSGSGGKRGEERSATLYLRGSDRDFIDLIDQLELEVSGGLADRLKRVLCSATGLVDPGPEKPDTWRAKDSGA